MTRMGQKSGLRERTDGLQLRLLMSEAILELSLKLRPDVCLVTGKAGLKLSLNFASNKSLQLKTFAIMLDLQYSEPVDHSTRYISCPDIMSSRRSATLSMVTPSV